MGQGLDALMHLRAPYPTRFLDADVRETCIAHDILCVQELLSRDAQRFFDGLGVGHSTSRFRDDNRFHFGSRTVRGSGLGIHARAPFTKALLRTFPVACVGWDRLARKGALHAQLAIEGVLIDVVTVHLQAGQEPLAQRVRCAQLLDLKAFLDASTTTDRPCIVCGDFNVDGSEAQRSSEEYRVLLGAMDGFQDLGIDDDLPTLDPEPTGNGLAHIFEPRARRQRIDYIFFRAGRGGPRLRPTAIARFFDRPLTRTRFRNGPAWASDHYGLSATFSL